MLLQIKEKPTWVRVIALTCALCVLLMGVAACQANSSKKQPAWVMNTPNHPGYIYGVGTVEIFGRNEANALARAKDVARVELLKQIKVDISGAVEQEIKEVTRNSETVLTQNLRSAVTSKVPEFTLSHVEQVDSYLWPGGERISVMMRFDVNEELASLAEQIAAMDQQLKTYEVKLEDNAESNLSSLRLLSPALVIADQRAGLQARRNELDSSRRFEPLLTDEIRVLVARIYEFVAKLRVSVSSESDEDASFRTNLVSQLTKRGLSVSPASQADAQIAYTLRVNEVKRGNAIFVMTEGDVSLKDEQGRIVKAFQAKAKGGASDAVEARSRSIIKLADALGNALLEALLK